ncbi:MAG: UDP-N-acetylmuramate--L-alanine ligase [bacterium]|nr:UDP-N-acetylmuramate--L-alanine ligase [bacterium]
MVEISIEDKLYFIGIGGYGMSGIAQILHQLGYNVKGSDIKNSETTKRLSSLGIPIYIGHRPENIGDSTVVVVSSAVHSDNPELIEAKRRNLVVLKRGEMLAYLMSKKRSIGVAGAHGKTTLTSMIGLILDIGGLSPTVIVGGEATDIGGTARLGKGELLVAETDESDGSFLYLFPNIEVITNVDNDHLDYYKDIENIKEAFIKFTEQAKELVFVCGDDEFLRDVPLKKEKITYGLSSYNTYSVKNINLKESGSIFEVTKNGKSIGSIELSIPGLHNVRNALGAIAVADWLGTSWDSICRALKIFKGVNRRLQVCDTIGSSKIIEDYAHHPTEIKASLEAIRILANGKKVILVFQPHRYTRTYYLYREIAKPLSSADYILLLDVYPASEPPIEGVDSGLILNSLSSLNKNSKWIRDRETLEEELEKIGINDSIIVFMGAGDIDCIRRQVISRLKEKLEDMSQSHLILR